MEGILFVLETGVPWKKLPSELGFGSGITCWQRVREWQDAGVWEQSQRAVLDRLGQQGMLGLVTCLLGLGQCPSEKGDELTGPNPTDRGKSGTKYHLLVTADGLPLAIAVTGANRHDSMLVEPILDRLRPVKIRGRGRPQRRPVQLHADKAYDNRRVRRYLCRRGITAHIARIGIDSSERLGRHRWVVERTVAWLLTFRRLAPAAPGRPPTRRPQRLVHRRNVELGRIETTADPLHPVLVLIVAGTVRNFVCGGDLH
jgi:transposase